MVHGGSVKGKCKHHHNIGLVTGMHEPAAATPNNAWLTWFLASLILLVEVPTN